MAIQTIKQLKAWFRKGLYPTEGQFADLIDSFRHKGERVPIQDVEGLTEAVNGKYDSSEAAILEKKVQRHDSAIEQIQDTQENQSLEISDIHQTDEAQQAEIDAARGDIAKIREMIKAEHVAHTGDATVVSRHAPRISAKEDTVYTNRGFIGLLCKGWSKRTCPFVISLEGMYIQAPQWAQTSNLVPEIVPLRDIATDMGLDCNCVTASVNADGDIEVTDFSKEEARLGLLLWDYRNNGGDDPYGMRGFRHVALRVDTEGRRIFHGVDCAVTPRHNLPAPQAWELSAMVDNEGKLKVVSSAGYDGSTNGVRAETEIWELKKHTVCTRERNANGSMNRVRADCRRLWRRLPKRVYPGDSVARKHGALVRVRYAVGAERGAWAYFNVRLVESDDGERYIVKDAR